MEIDNKKQEDNYCKAVMLGLVFMLLFSPFQSVSNMIGLLYEQSGNQELGLISLFVLYCAFGINCIFAANFCAKYNPKYVMCISSLGYTLYSATGILVYICYDENYTTGLCSQTSIYIVVNACALINGICSSTLWVAQPWYIQNISTPQTRGRYFGVFWALMQSSQVFGNVLGLVLLEESALFYFIIMTTISAISGMLFLFLPTIHIHKQPIKTLNEKLRGMLRLFCSNKMRPVLMYYFFSGTIVAVYTGFLYKQVKRSQPEAQTDEEKQYIATLAAYVYIVLGIFEFIGGILSGHIADKYNRFLIAQNTTILSQIALVTSIISYYEESYLLCFVSGALWGLSDCMQKNMTTVLTTELFPGRIEAFGIRALMSSMGVSVMLIINVNLSHPVLYLGVVASVGLINEYCTTRININI